MAVSIYFAGPDVFHPDFISHRSRIAALCSARGLDSLFPGDEVSGDDPQSIFQDNLRLIAKADAVIANLNAFRGAEPDSGTCFELGYAYALRKRLLGYIDLAESVVERVQRLEGPLGQRDGRLLDSEGYQVEDFALPLNLMLAVPVEVVVGDLTACLHALDRGSAHR